jgi:hypothetical protein
MIEKAQSEIDACAREAATELGAVAVMMIVSYMNIADGSIHIEMAGQAPFPPDEFLAMALAKARGDKENAERRQSGEPETDSADDRDADKPPETRQ